MATLELKDSRLVLHIHGWNKLRALRGSVSVPLSHVGGVRPRPEEGYFDDVIIDSWRGIGTYVPGHMCIGTVQLHDGRSFFDVRHPERALAIDLIHDPLKHLVVELDDETPEHAADRILAAFARDEGADDDDAETIVDVGITQEISRTIEDQQSPYANDAEAEAPPGLVSGILETGPALSEGRATIAIVVGIDFSPLSAHLLRTARDLVRAHTDAELHVVHVRQPPAIPPELGGAMGRFYEAASDIGAKQTLDALCGAVLGEDRAPLVTHVRVGDPADEIPAIAREVGADLIVVEAHGRRGLERMFHRSLAARLSRNAPCSVLTIRPREGDEPAQQIA